MAMEFYWLWKRIRIYICFCLLADAAALMLSVDDHDAASIVTSDACDENKRAIIWTSSDEQKIASIL
jgi:hypothetical protein